MQSVISIIIPVYCAEKFLYKCINSILNQSYKQWELILINDGSTDNSAKICDSFAERDNRIKVVHQNNSGVSKARNVGIEMATGKYITFIDSDDWVDENYLKSLIQYMKEDTSIVIGGYKWISYKEISRKGVIHPIVLTLNQFREKFDLFYSLDILNPPFGKLYRNDIIRNQRFDPSIQLGEDLLFNLAYFGHSSKIVLISNFEYNYNVLNTASATKKIRENDFDSIIKHFQEAKNFKYMDNKWHLDEIDKRLCTNGIGLIQLAFYREFSENIKAENIVKEWLDNDIFNKVLSQRYNLPLKLKISQLFCVRKSIFCLRLYYFLKFEISRIIRKEDIKIER